MTPKKSEENSQGCAVRHLPRFMALGHILTPNSFRYPFQNQEFIEPNEENILYPTMFGNVSFIALGSV